MEVFSIKLSQKFRGITHREGLLVQGAAGWGEYSPFLEYAETSAWKQAALEAAELGFPEPVRTEIPVNVTVPAVSPQVATEIVLAGGCQTAKVKVAEPGQDLAADLARVRAVRAALGEHGKIRVDANGGWDLAQAVTAIKSLDQAVGLEYVEQPCMAVTDLAKVRRQVSVLIAADESIRRAEDPYLVRDLAAADIAVLKVQPLGGVRACLEIAEAIGLPVVVSSAVETSIGLAAGVALAAALPELPFACGLATGQLLEQDVCDPALLPTAGMLPVTAFRPDPQRLLAVAATSERKNFWVQRFASA